MDFSKNYFQDTIRQLPHFCSIPLYGLIEECAKPEVVWIVKDEIDNYRHLIEAPKVVVEFRSGLFTKLYPYFLANVFVVCLKIPSLYGPKTRPFLGECYLNYFVKNDGKEIIRSLSEQNTLKMMFFAGEQHIRSIAIRNPLKITAKETLKVVDDKDPWSMSDFDKTKANIQKRYELHELWNELKGK